MKRLLAISALALIATACGPKESRMILLECREDKKDKPPTIEQIKKATAEDPDRVKKILLSGADGSESYKEDYGKKYPHYPFIWVIDKKLGTDYEYSSFEEAMVPYQDPHRRKRGLTTLTTHQLGQGFRTTKRYLLASTKLGEKMYF